MSHEWLLDDAREIIKPDQIRACTTKGDHLEKVVRQEKSSEKGVPTIIEWVKSVVSKVEVICKHACQGKHSEDRGEIKWRLRPANDDEWCHCLIYSASISIIDKKRSEDGRVVEHVEEHTKHDFTNIYEQAAIQSAIVFWRGQFYW